MLRAATVTVWEEVVKGVVTGVVGVLEYRWTKAVMEEHSCCVVCGTTQSSEEIWSTGRGTIYPFGSSEDF